MKVYTDFNLTEYNSYRVQSKCAKAYFPESEEDIVELYQRGNNYILLGSGHNIILSKSYYQDEFVIFNGNFEAITQGENNNVIIAESGVTMLRLSTEALERGLSGLEIFYDIPSSLGGAVVMNAGASGEEIKDVLIKVRYLDLSDMQIKEIVKQDMDFTYRNSYFQRNTNNIILKAWLELYPKEKDLIRQKMDQIKAARWAKQPKNLPNAGSVFKRPKGFYVGAMIDELNLKGFTIGGAQVSPKHGGFIVNMGDATGEDILAIIREVKARVLNRFGVDLEVEQRVI
jgi:UDP-N-acetylmuramate dehydrogenase